MVNQISITLSEELIKTYNEAAKENGLLPAQLGRIAIVEYLRRLGYIGVSDGDHRRKSN